MPAQTTATQDQQHASTPQITKEYSNGGTAKLVDNRPMTVLQRKIRESMAQPRMPQGSMRFQQIATAMGDSYGVDTSSLKATHSSSFPGSLNAEATIQGNNIHFAPGMDTDYNIRHEVAHAIDNTLHGPPQGDSIVQGQRVDTTREGVVDRMARQAQNEPRDVRGSLNVDFTDAQDLATGATVAQRKRIPKTSLIQCRTVLVGENHGAQRLAVGGRNLPPSSVAAALITGNNFAAPQQNNYVGLLAAQAQGAGLQALAALGEQIWLGHDNRWGAEDMLMGTGSAAVTAYGQQAVAPADNRTHIEDATVRTIGSFFIRLSANAATTIRTNFLRQFAVPNTTLQQIMALAGGLGQAAPMPNVPPNTNLAQEWNNQRTNGTDLFALILPGADPATYPGGQNAYEQAYAADAIQNYENGLAALMTAALLDLNPALTALGAPLNNALNALTNIPGTNAQTIALLAGHGAGAAANKLQWYGVAFGSYARSLAMWGRIGMHRTGPAPLPNMGFILGNQHVVHLDPNNNQLPALIRQLVPNPVEFIRHVDYNTLTQAAINAALLVGQQPGGAPPLPPGPN